MATYSRPSSCFAVTFNHVEWTKDCFAEFILASDDVQRLAIAQEEHHPPLDCITGEAPPPAGYHHHVFIEFITPKYLEEVRNICAEFLGDEPRSVNVQVGVLLRYIDYILVVDLHFSVANLQSPGYCTLPKKMTDPTSSVYEYQNVPCTPDVGTTRNPITELLNRSTGTTHSLYR